MMIVLEQFNFDLVATYMRMIFNFEAIPRFQLCFRFAFDGRIFTYYSSYKKK